MKVTATTLPGALLIEPRLWPDRRGFFFESYNRRAFRDAGITVDWVQDNHSRSCKGVLRGLHYQAPPHAQDKLVRVTAGSVFDVIVDLRDGSPGFGHWFGVELSAANRRMLFVPEGFAHGFCVLSEAAEVLYKCSDFYAPEAARGILWNDPDLAVAWPLPDPILSEQDTAHPRFAERTSEFVYTPPAVQ